MFKVILTPTDILLKSFELAQTKGFLSVYYKNICLLIHPDKNKHHLSTTAF